MREAKKEGKEIGERDKERMCLCERERVRERERERDRQTDRQTDRQRLTAVVMSESQRRRRQSLQPFSKTIGCFHKTVNEF